MSQISANIIVQPLDVTVQVTETPINITPEGINLNVYTAGGGGLPGGNTGELQYNNGLFAGIPNVTYANGNLTLTNIANLKVPGGTNGYFIQTDGAGNLTFAAGGGGGNGSPGGSNTQIQYNDNGVFGGNTGFTFNEVSGDVNIPGNLVVSGNVSGNLSVSNVANANYANFASNVITSAQPNITSLGTLTGVNVNGIANAVQFVSNVTTGNAPLLVNSTTQVANLNADLLDGYQPSVSNVANTIVVRDANTDITVGNITANIINGTLGNITGLSRISNGNSNVDIASANGNITFGVTGVANVAVVANTGFYVTGALRTTETKIQLGSNSNASSVSIAIGSNATANGGTSVAIGNLANASGAGALAIGARPTASGNYSIAIGIDTIAANANSIAIGGEAVAGTNTVAIGTRAQSGFVGSIAIGANTGQYLGNRSIAVGNNAGQSAGTIAYTERVLIGANAGINGVGNQAIAIGFSSGNQQRQGAIAIGSYAAGSGGIGITQGVNSIAIGANAGYPSSMPNNSIIINATGANLQGTSANALFIKPIRTVNSTAGLNQLYYDSTTGEIVVYVP